MTPEEINAEALRIAESAGLPLAQAAPLHAAICAFAKQVHATARRHNWSPEKRAAQAARMRDMRLRGIGGRGVKRSHEIARTA